MVWKGLGLMGGVARGGFWLNLERKSVMTLMNMEGGIYRLEIGPLHFLCM